MDLSVIIVNFNTKGLLKNCLKSIFDRTFSVDLEVFVVDNASSDGSVKMVEHEFSQVKLIENHKNLGFGKANNQAMKLCSGRYILLLNSDTILLDNAFEKMKLFMDENSFIGLSTCKLLNSDGTLQIHCGRMDVRVYKLFRMLRDLLNITLGRNKEPFQKIDPMKILFRKPHEVRWITGAFMMVRREVIDEIGMLDENFFIYGEDNDWCIRIRNSGWKLWFYPEAQIIHYGGESFSKCPSSQVIDWQFNSEYYLMNKHYSKLRSYYWKCSSMIDSLCKAIFYGLWTLVPVNKKTNDYARQKHEYHKYKYKKYKAVKLK